MDWIYAAGVDGATGGTARTQFTSKAASDDFALATWRWKTGAPAELVNVYRASGMTAPQQAAKIHEFEAAFNYDVIVLDSGGGGPFIRDELREPIQDDGKKKWTVTPLITKDDDHLRGVGKDKVVFFGRSDSRIKGDNRPDCPGIGLVLTSESFLINKAHELLKGAIEHDPPGVIFPKEEALKLGYDSPDALRDFLNTVTLGAHEKAQYELDLALWQLIQIGRELEKDGVTPVTDKGGFYSFTSDSRKDSAYSVIYGFFGIFLLKMELRVLTPKPTAHISPVFGIEIM